MANITTTRTGQLMRELFQVVLEHPEGIHAAEALRELESRIELTDYEQNDHQSGGRRLERIVRFSTIACVKAGWMTKRKGVWTITEEGTKAFDEFADPAAFWSEANRRYRFRIIYDSACAASEMLSVSENLILARNECAQLTLYGHEINAQTYGIAEEDLLLRREGDAANNIVGCPEHSTIAKNAFPSREFDSMLHIPSLGKSWKRESAA